MADLLPEFHQHALRAVNGRASVLLRLNPRSGHFQADSAAGIDHLEPLPWLADVAGHALADQCLTDGTPRVLADNADLSSRLETPQAVIAPLRTRDLRLGVLVVGIENVRPSDEARNELLAVADLLSLALDRARLHREADLQHDLSELAANLTRAVSSSLDLGASLEVFCDRAARLFAADRVSVWLHDRRARVLEVVASSDAAEVAAGLRIPADDSSVAVSLMMRHHEARVFAATEERTPNVLAPLRGRRRALGTLELRGVRIETGDAIDMLDRVEEVARQLSSSIENVWLLEDVIGSRRELQSTFDSLTDLVVVTDERLRITHANRAFAERVGLQPKAVAEHTLHDFFSRDVIGWIQAVGATVSPDKGHDSRELTDTSLDATFLFTVSPLVRGDERIGTVVVARDVSVHSRLEAERAELQSRLTQSEKLAALGQFVAGIAHELNNPLQGVLGHVELMLQQRGPSQMLRRDLKLVFREADRAAKIVHNLLVFAGSRRITRRRLNVNHVVNKVLTMRAPACAAASIQVVKDVASKLPRVAGDALLLQQALLNIVVNAEQAMVTAPGPHRLEVRTRAIGDTKVEIRIADSGPGIPALALPRVFEPFFTTKEVGKGTGLGLAIAYGTVQEHQGRLEVSNRAEGGAMFTLTLPAESSDAVE